MLTKRAIELEKKFYQDMKKHYISQLQLYRQGTIQTRLQHGKKRLFFHDKKRTIYISKKRSDLIRAHLHRRIISRLLSIIDNNIDLLSSMERSYKYFSDDIFAEVVAAETDCLSRKINGSVHERLSVSFIVEESAAKGADARISGEPPFGYSPTNSFMPEHRIHKTPGGVLVRSKSELIIGSMLEAKGMRYEYEHLVFLEGNPVYPDFTIRRKSDDTPVLWEHFGLMSDAAYRAKNTQKIIQYLNCGYRLGHDLIITYDDDNGSIDMEQIERIIGCML